MVVMTVYVLPILYMVHVTRMSVVTSSILVTSMAVKLSNQWVYIYIYHTWCVPSLVMTGRSRAVPAAAPPSARLPAAAPGQEPPERHAVPPGAAERFLQIDRPVPARRPGRNRLGRAVPANGSCPTAGQEPPRSGGSCAGAGQQPPHHSWVLHHPCADASYIRWVGAGTSKIQYSRVCSLSTDRDTGIAESADFDPGHESRLRLRVSTRGSL